MSNQPGEKNDGQDKNQKATQTLPDLNATPSNLDSGVKTPQENQEALKSITKPADLIQGKKVNLDSIPLDELIKFVESKGFTVSTDLQYQDEYDDMIRKLREKKYTAKFRTTKPKQTEDYTKDNSNLDPAEFELWEKPCEGCPHPNQCWDWGLIDGKHKKINYCTGEGKPVEQEVKQ